MKKIIYCISVVLISLVLFSCKSTKTEEKDGLKLTGDVQDEKVEAPKESKKEKKETPVKRDPNEKADRGFIGWIDVSVKDPVYEEGSVKIKSDSKLGTFCIFALEEDGKANPVLSTLNEYSSTAFYLKAGKKVYKLISSKNVNVGAKELKNGIELLYEVNNVARVSVDLTAVPSVAGKPADTVKINAKIINTGKKADSFALKTILDTVLGEKAKYHFYTSDEKPVKNEISSRALRGEKWFISKNEEVAMQILLDGGDVTTPEFVALANYATLANAEWEPNMLTYRAFDTVLSYNNSAVELIWPSVRLAPGESANVTFYISLALYGKNPTGHYYVYGIKPPVETKPEVPVYIPEVKKEPETVIPPVKEQKPVEEKKEPVVVPVPEVPAPVVKESVPESAPVVENITTPEPVTTPENVPDVEFNVRNISKDHLTQEYIDTLITRINELEASSVPVNRKEILELNAELDAILSILRQ